MHLNYTYETCKNGIIWDSQALTGSDKKKIKIMCGVGIIAFNRSTSYSTPQVYIKNIL